MLMRHVRASAVVLAALLCFVSAASAQSTLPPQIDTAISLLSQALGRPLALGDFDRYGFSQAFYADSALGCPLVAATTVYAVPVSAFTIELIFQGVRYEFRVRDDLSAAFPCDAALLVLTPAAPGSAATPSAPGCPIGYAGFLRPRLVSGGQGSIGADGTPNRVRARPSVDAEQIGLIDPGTTFDILEGPSCDAASGIVWWRVNVNGLVGWTAEGLGDNYFIDPVAGGPLNLPPERSLITADAAFSLVPLAQLPSSEAAAVAFSPDGKVAIGSIDGLVIYDLFTGEEVLLNLNLDISPVQVAWSSDGHYLAFATADNVLYVVDLRTGSAITPAGAPNTDIRTIGFGANGLLATGGGIDGTPPMGASWTIYDIPNQRLLATTEAVAPVRDVAFSPDGQLFAWVDSALNVINVSDGATLFTQAITVPASAAPVGTPAPADAALASPGAGLAWRPAGTSPDGLNQLAFAEGNLIRTITFGGAAGAYTGAPSFFPNVLAYSPDGTMIAAVNYQRYGAQTPAVLAVFNTATGEQILGAAYPNATSLAFSPDGTLLVVATRDMVYFLGVDPQTAAVG